MMPKVSRKDSAVCAVEWAHEKHFVSLQAGVGDEKESQENE